MEDAFKLGVQNYVNGLKFSDEGAKPRGMEFTAIYTTGVLGKTPSRVLVIIDRLVLQRADGSLL